MAKPPVTPAASWTCPHHWHPAATGCDRPADAGCPAANAAAQPRCKRADHALRYLLAGCLAGVARPDAASRTAAIVVPAPAWLLRHRPWHGSHCPADAAAHRTPAPATE